MRKIQKAVTPPPTSAECVGRDEMNLAEFPLALLSERSSAGAVTFTRERSLVLPDGSSLQQMWQVTASPAYGLPQPSDEDVMLGLLKIAADNGFESPMVRFTQSTLLSLLQWRLAGFYFKRLEQALARLKTTAILATNAFWNHTTKAYQTRHFGIIDSYELYERRASKSGSQMVALSSNWARFSTEFFSSIQAGYLKPLDLTLYFSLQSSVSKRLYRFLDKKRHKKDQFSINLQQLATVHLGLSESTCRYISWIKRELDRAHHELIERGFIEKADYGENKNGQPKVTYTFNQRAPAHEQLTLPTPIVVPDAPARLVAMLVERGVSPAIARDLVASKPITLVDAQIDVFDHLCAATSKGKPLNNPGGFLTAAIRNEWALRPPGYVPRAVREERARATLHATAERTSHQEKVIEEQQNIEDLRASLPEQMLELLREEAFEQARTQLGATFRLRRDSRMVDAFLNGILQERYIDVR